MKFDNYKVIDNRVFFTSSFLSNWYPATFESTIAFGKDISAKLNFNCVEQAMMAAKAALFEDYESFARIMRAESPKEQKELGRGVKNYVDADWAAIRLDVVRNALYNKFSSNLEMYQAMLGFPAGTEFVEAAAYDNVWGIGLGITDPNLADESKWTGQNLLGKAITQVHGWILRDEQE